MLKKLIDSQGGDVGVIDDYKKFKQAKYKYEFKTDKSGFVKNVDAYKIAYACKLLGAGREKKSDSVDFSAGIELKKIYSDKVQMNDAVAILYSDNEEKIETAIPFVIDAFEFCENPPSSLNLVYKII